MLWKGLIILIVLALLGFLAMLIYKAHLSKQGQAAGLVDHRLTQCPSTPNCVCSEYWADNGHFIEPIVLHGASTLVMPRLKQAIEAMGGVVIKQDSDYLAATFTSDLFGFVDDVELRFDEVSGLVQMRSASRQGYSDMGVNRKRMERLKQQLNTL